MRLNQTKLICRYVHGGKQFLYFHPFMRDPKDTPKSITNSSKEGAPASAINSLQREIGAERRGWGQVENGYSSDTGPPPSARYNSPMSNMLNDAVHSE